MEIIIKATALNDGKKTLYEKVDSKYVKYVMVEINGEVTVLNNGESRKIKVTNTMTETGDFDELMVGVTDEEKQKLYEYLKNATYVKPLRLSEVLGIPPDVVRLLLHKGQALGLFRDTARGFRVVPEKQSILRSMIIKKEVSEE